MNLSEYSIQEMSKIIIGDTNECIYLSLKEIVNLFNCFGERDVFESGKKLIKRGENIFILNQGMPTREKYCRSKLVDINNTIQINNLLIRLLSTNCQVDRNAFINKINTIINEDGYNIQLIDNEYIIQSRNTTNINNIQLKPIFSDIEPQIIKKIEGAKLSIWIAMGYFTSKNIFEALKKKELESLDLRFVLSTESSNSFLKFDDFFRDICWIEANVYGSYYDGSQKKSIMHNKYCIIDMETIITGSYNWTENAKKNEENIITIDYSNNIIDYVKNFLKLRKKSLKR
jgi:phosphatidylserine/phosphatidylglycerophosphate/cardiolipin synthase-like enzyme